jgi:GDSL-like Lipase/Acylhydrolase family
MRRVSFDDVRFAGALDTDVTADGVVLRRLPAWTRNHITDIQLALMVTMPAGVRIELVTDSRDLELDVMLTLLDVNGRAKPAVFDAVVDGNLIGAAETSSGLWVLYDARTGNAEFRPGEPTTIRFRDLPIDAPASVEIWLPQDCVVELRELRAHDDAIVSVGPDRRRRRWVHHGSSISHCMEALRPTATWPAVAARLADVDLLDLAFAGQCMLDPFVARTIRDLPAELISIKAGINIVNGDALRERTFGPVRHRFLDTIREGHPDTPIALATPIICPIVEEHPGPTALGDDLRFFAVARPPELAVGALTLRRIRELAAEIVDARRAAGDARLHLVDGLALFGAGDVADLYDDLHPNADGYQRIGERFHAIAFSDDGPFAV